MASPAPADVLRPQPTDGLGRGAMMATLVHGLLIVAIAFGVSWRASDPEGVAAELWAAVPQVAAPPAAAPTPAPTPVRPTPEPPRPQPAPTPAPPPPQVQRDADIAIEKERERQRKLQEEREKRELEEKQRLEKQRLEQERLEKQRLEKERAEKERLDKERQQKEKEKAAAERRQREEQQRKAEDARLAKLREENLQRMMGQVGSSAGVPGGTGAPGSTGTAARDAGPSAGYAGRIKARIKPNIVLTDEVPGNPTAEVEVKCAPDGTIVGRRLVKSSGQPAWDDAVLRAIDRTAELPRDVDGRVPGTILIAFRPRD